jgi:anti-sigma B factor antagonist
MEITEKEMNDILIFSIKGEIMGGPESEIFQKKLYGAVEEGKVNVVVDMSHATWMNSSGLGMLISGLTTLRSSGGDLLLTNMSERLQRPLEITKLDSVFKIFDSVQSAVESFK